MTEADNIRMSELHDSTKRLTDWLDAGKIGAAAGDQRLKYGGSCHLRRGEVRITNLEWCRREADWLVAHGRRSLVIRAGKHVAIFVARDEADMIEIIKLPWEEFTIPSVDAAKARNTEGESGDGCATVKP